MSVYLSWGEKLVLLLVNFIPPQIEKLTTDAVNIWKSQYIITLNDKQNFNTIKDEFINY